MIMSKNIDIFNILSGGERVTLECKKQLREFLLLCGKPIQLSPIRMVE